MQISGIIRKYFVGLLILIVGMFQACTQTSKVDNYKFDWENVVITSEKRVKIYINNLDDSTTVIYHHVGTIFSPLKEKLLDDTSKVYFSRLEKDSLAILAHDLITTQVETTAFCTEFVGNLRLDLRLGNVTQSVEYSSVCNWNKLSDKTLLMHKILKRKMPDVFLGENIP